MSNLRGLNRIEIRSMDDFPVQDATTVTLSTFEYDIRTTLVTDKQFILEDGAVIEFIGWDPSISGLVYTGVLSAFTGTNFTTFTHDHVFISTPLGTIFDADNVAPVAAQIFMEDTVYIDCLGIGIVKNIEQFSGYFNAFVNIGQGFDLESVRLINFSQITLNSWKNEVGAVMFTFDGDVDSVQLNAVEYIPNTNESIFDFKVGLNVTSSNITSNIYNKTLGGALFAPGSRDQTDIFLNFAANSGMPKSIVFGNMTLPSTETVTISSAGVPVVVNDASTGGTNIWSELGMTSRFTFDSTLGRFTYIGLEDVNVIILASSSIEKVGGGQDFIATTLMKNGSIITESKSGSQNTNPTNVMSIGDVALSTGDFIELSVQNDDGISNITINLNNFIIKD